MVASRCSRRTELGAGISWVLSGSLRAPDGALLRAARGRHGLGDRRNGSGCKLRGGCGGRVALRGRAGSGLRRRQAGAHGRFEALGTALQAGDGRLWRLRHLRAEQHGQRTDSLALDLQRAGDHRTHGGGTLGAVQPVSARASPVARKRSWRRLPAPAVARPPGGQDAADDRPPSRRDASITTPRAAPLIWPHWLSSQSWMTVCCMDRWVAPALDRAFCVAGWQRFGPGRLQALCR